eukprot:IDg9256t1
MGAFPKNRISLIFGFQFSVSSASEYKSSAKAAHTLSMHFK